MMRVHLRVPRRGRQKYSHVSERMDWRENLRSSRTRSSPEILDLANESLSRNERQFQKELVAVRERAENRS